jgi:hypothetical protein
LSRRSTSARPVAIQARLLFETAKRMVRGHPELERRITPRYSELRVDSGFLRVIASDARWRTA